MPVLPHPNPMRYALAAAFVMLAAPVQAQSSFFGGLYVEAGPSATVGAVGGAESEVGPGFAVEAGWSGSRVAFFVGGTGGFVENSPALWARVRDAQARVQGESATRSTLATLDYGFEYHLADSDAVTVPFVGVSGTLPVYATERRDADNRVLMSGRGVSPRFGVRQKVSRGVAVSASVALFSGSLSRGFVGEEGSGHAVEIERSRVRGAHAKVGLSLRPGAWLSSAAQ